MRSRPCLWISVFFAATILDLGGRLRAQPALAPPGSVPSAPAVARVDAVPRETYRLGCQLRAQPPEGLLVMSVRPGGPATRLVLSNNPNVTGQLEPGDVITQIDGHRITSLADYRRTMDASVERGGHVALLVRDVNGGGEQLWQAQGSREQVVGPPGAVRIRMVHFLFIGLTDDDRLGEAIRYNLDALQHMAHSQIDERRVATVKVIEGSQCTADNILHEVADLPLSYDDTVFCHYSGHGAYDPAAAPPNDRSNGHHFKIPSGDLMRWELWQALKRHGVRLTVLMTDTCNVRATARLGARRQYTIMSGAQPYSHLEQLLLGYRGSIDISASDTDQFAWYSINPDNSPDFDRSGGWFTTEVCNVLPAYNDWSVAFDQLQSTTNRKYQERRERLLADPNFRDDPADRDQGPRASLERQEEMKPRDFVFTFTRDDQSLATRAAPAERRTLTVSTWALP